MVKIGCTIFELWPFKDSRKWPFFRMILAKGASKNKMAFS